MLFGNLRRVQRGLRDQLTVGERLAAYCYLLISVVVPPSAAGLLMFGGATQRPVGIGLLLLALVLFAVPLSPILRARVRRRQARSGAVE